MKATLACLPRAPDCMAIHESSLRLLRSGLGIGVGIGLGIGLGIGIGIGIGLGSILVDHGGALDLVLELRA